MTSRDTTNAISSPESEDGATRSDSPDGPMTDLFGQPVVPVHRSVSPESRRSALSAKARALSGALEELASQYALTANTLGLPMPATYGRKFGDSQLNLDLDAYSESRLTQWEHSRGSLLYQHRLKYSATPLGRRVCRLQASARPIFDNDCGGLAGPTATGWPTPTAMYKHGGLQTSSENALRRKASGHMLNLDDAAQLAGWTTPQAHDVSPRGAGNRKNPKGGGACLAWDAKMAGWPTPMAATPNSLRGTGQDPMVRKAGGHQVGLQDAVRLVAGWATPTSRDHKDGTTDLTQTPVNSILGRQVNLSPAMTTKRGQLNPAFSLWLMGYPKHWMAVAPSRASASLGARAMQSFPNAQPDLSGPGPTEQ